MLDVYIELEVAAHPGGGSMVRKPLLPVLLGSRPYGGGSFFEYLEWWFMAIEPVDGRWMPELDEDQRPMLYAGDDLLGQYESVIGHNLDDELFHPDEILAQNWVFVANEPSLGLLVDMDKILRSG